MKFGIGKATTNADRKEAAAFISPFDGIETNWEWEIQLPELHFQEVVLAVLHEI